MKQVPDRSLGNDHCMAVGQSRSGKTEWVRRQTAKARRLLAWDPDREYQGKRYTSKRAFLKAVEESGGNLRACLTVDPTRGNFDWFCRLVLATMSADRPTVVIAEEVADVTNQGKASGAWGQLVRRGGKYGLTIYAVAQSPAEVDKTAFKQFPNRFCGFLEFPSDVERMRQMLGLAKGQADFPPPAPERGPKQTRIHYWYKAAEGPAKHQTFTVKGGRS